MWPWEHVAVGYLACSLGGRALGSPPPRAVDLLAVVVGTQLPDLVDKPLSWGLGLFPSGFAVGHSVVLAVPLGLAVLALGARRGRLRVGAAFVVGYWSHLVSDSLNPLRQGEPADVGRVLWPVATASSYERDLGLGRGLAYLGEFVAGLSSMSPESLFVQVLALPLATLLLWLHDGAPGWASTVRAVRTLRRA